MRPLGVECGVYVLAWILGLARRGWMGMLRGRSGRVLRRRREGGGGGVSFEWGGMVL